MARVSEEDELAGSKEASSRPTPLAAEPSGPLTQPSSQRAFNGLISKEGDPSGGTAATKQASMQVETAHQDEDRTNVDSSAQESKDMLLQEGLLT